MKRRAYVNEAPGPLSGSVASAVGCDSTKARGFIEAGAVYVNGKRVRVDRQVDAGVKVLVVLEETGAESAVPSTPAAALEVLFEDAEVLVVNKAAGVVAQPTPGRVGDSLVDLASQHLRYTAGLVHRLDRETSGITVFGKTREATSRLAEAFRLGHAQKEYLAITAKGLPERGSIDWPLSKDPSRPGRWRASRQANGIDALTLFERVGETATQAVVALFPQTGRTHQLRAHLTSLGYPIVGDALYGGPPGPRCLLHARRLSVLGHVFEAPVPDDMRSAVAELSGR